MTEFKKKELLDYLNEIQEIITLAYGAITYVLRDREMKKLETANAVYHGRWLKFKDLAEEFRDKNTKAQRIVDFIDFVEKFLLREPFTILDEYCRINQIKDFEKQKWYHFARILRNYATHSYLDPNKNDSSIFPLRWENNEITWDEILNSKIDFTKFDRSMPMDLYDEIKQFAENLPENK